MIRRKNDHDWLLIAQADHARIAADIARAWRFLSDCVTHRREELLAAVKGHDDGWPAWETAPTIDPRTGRPRDFTEMPMEDATRIWSESINLCAGFSPWSGLWVSRHFCWLAQRALESRDSASDAEALDEFLGAQARLRESLRQKVGDDETRANVDSIEQAGYRWVQFFDLLSLWICCAERTQPRRFSIAGGDSVTATPGESGVVRFNRNVLCHSPLELQTDALRVPVRRFQDDAELQRSLQAAPRVSLTWRLVCDSPGGGESG